MIIHIAYIANTQITYSSNANEQYRIGFDTLIRVLLYVDFYI